METKVDSQIPYAGICMLLGALVVLLSAIFYVTGVISDNVLTPLIAIAGVMEIGGLSFLLMNKGANKQPRVLADKDADSGKPIFNLRIGLRCNQREFRDLGIMTAEDQIERLGIAVKSAKKIFKGFWHVTDKGYLFRGFQSNLQERAAIIEIDNNVTELVVFREVLEGKAVSKDYRDWIVHAHFEGGPVVNFKVKDGRLCVD